ncbi:MAG TPA: helix-turn-helix domain-containing protein [Polyangiaceae bacterium]|nr:helix-turn-helix domain-containing protein [Polyangiaceae bacterium]
MPAALLSKPEILDRLMVLFRQKGYDGASLADIAEVTGLGKSSLYHHFPGGKVEMAREVMAHLSSQLEPALANVHGPGTPRAKLQAFLKVVEQVYDSGRLACLLERLCASAERKKFAKPLHSTFGALLQAFELLCVEAGQSKSVARGRAEDAVVRIQGSLVLAAGVEQPEIFMRALGKIRETLLEGKA